MTKNTKKIWKLIGFYFVAAFCIMIIHTTLFAPYKIPSGSMIPTILIGDIVVSNELAYGLKFPTLNKYFFKTRYIANKTNPKRGDVIIFKSPIEPGLLYVKRLVGVPGDSLKMVGGVLYINGVPTPSEEIDRPDVDLGKFEERPLVFYKSEINGKEFTYMRDLDSFNTRMHEINLKENEYFAMGDNRDHSADSRVFGPISREAIIAKAELMVFSMDISFSELGIYHPDRFLQKIN